MQNVIEIINTTRQKIDKVGMQFGNPYLERCEDNLEICIDRDDDVDLPYYGVAFTVDSEMYLQEVHNTLLHKLKNELGVVCSEQGG